MGLSLSALSRKLRRAKSTLHGLAARGAIPRLADGSFDADAVRLALAMRNAGPLHAPANGGQTRPGVARFPGSKKSISLRSPPTREQVMAMSDAEFDELLFAAAREQGLT